MKKYSWPLMKNTIGFSEKFNLIKHILFSNNFTQGKKVEEFEQAWSKWLGAKHSLFVSSGSAANFLLVAAIKEKYGLKAGDKVLVPACTWVTNINPIIQLGLTPVFCDINLNNFSFDIASMEKISKIHPDIKLIFVTHLLGIPAKNYIYQDIFPNALIIDDVCESHGCSFENELLGKVGQNSLGATFSFYFGHHMSTIEGGMISTNDAELYDLMKVKRSHGLARHSKNFDKISNQYPEIERSFLFVSDGYNFRNTELGAVLGLTQLKKIDKFIDIRRKNYDEFYNIIKPHTDKFIPLHYSLGNSSFCFPIISRTPEIKTRLIGELKNADIEFRPVVAGNLLKQPYLKGFKSQKCPYADLLHANGVYVGNNQFVDSKDLKKLKEILQKT
jgi:CDP-6-deoxy-D-xylo-4-hexulose-3-dehydrase